MKFDGNGGTFGRFHEKIVSALAKFVGRLTIFRAQNCKFLPVIRDHNLNTVTFGPGVWFYTLNVRKLTTKILANFCIHRLILAAVLNT